MHPLIELPDQAVLATNSFSHVQLMDKLFNRPLAITPDYFQTLLGAMAQRLNLSHVQLGEELVSAEKLRIKASSYEGRERKSYQVNQDGIAILPISGSLVHKYGYLQPVSGMTGYDGIKARLLAALNDADVNGIMLDFDSPGGEVAGCFVLAREMQGLTATKPIWSMTNELSCSAAFALASQANRRIITSTAVAGSVGVITAHVDRSQMLSEQGVKVTLLYSGQHKADGNGYEALPDAVKDDILGKLDALRREFADIVATGTGMDIKAVLDTEAQTYRGQDAVNIGFADAVQAPDDALAELAEHGREKRKGKKTFATTQPTQEPTMSEENTQTTASASDVKARVKAILASTEAQGRTELAEHLAFDTELSAEEATAILAKAPKATAVNLDQVMGEQQPLGEDAPDTTVKSRVADVKAIRAKLPNRAGR